MQFLATQGLAESGAGGDASAPSSPAVSGGVAHGGADSGPESGRGAASRASPAAAGGDARGGASGAGVAQPAAKDATRAQAQTREALKVAGRDPGDYDFDRCAGLPRNIEDMAKRINAKDQYDGLYRTHSLAVHWGLSSLQKAIPKRTSGPIVIEYRKAKDWRHVTVATSALTFAALTKVCAELAGASTMPFQRIESAVTRVVFQPSRGA